MNSETFQEILEDRINKIVATLGIKAYEYATNTDRLHNFKVAADFLQCSKAEALWGMLVKHLVSIQDLTRATAYTTEYIDEKIGDAINYLILLEACLLESS